MVNGVQSCELDLTVPLLEEKNPKKAEKVLQTLEKSLKNYPYAGDAQCERELVQLVKARSGAMA